MKGDIMVAISAVWSWKFRNFDQVNTPFISLLPRKKMLLRSRISGQLVLFTASDLMISQNLFFLGYAYIK
jgi:hypothetical protein